MRLTLRYLLAFMDGNLSPEDSQELGKRIEESETATSLLHRIRDVMRRLRLGAPAVLERGQGLDPNTVAEYLDHKLPDSQVPDFEKVCFESDVQLAEVASCHQVLSAVLREPAEIDPVSRQRMYALQDKVAAAEEEGPSLAAPPAAPPPHDGRGEVGKVERPSRPAVPDYLRDARSGRSWRTALGLAVAMAILLAVLALLNQMQPGAYVSGLLGSGEEAPRNGAAGDEKAHTAKPAAAPPTRDDEARPASGPAAPAALPAAPAIPSPPAKALPAEPPALPKLPPAAPADMPGPGPAPVEPKTPPAAEDTPLEQPAGALAPTARLPAVDPGAVPGPVAPSKPMLPPERVGVFHSPREVLLRLNPNTGSWQRLIDDSPLVSQERVMSLPAFRPTIFLASHIQVQLIDGAALALLPAGGQGIAGVALERGRVVLKPEEGAKPRVRLQIGDRQGVLAFQDSESTLAIDVGRTETPGADPEGHPGPLVADLYATTGKMVWQDEPDGKPVTLTAPIRATLAGQSLDTVALQQFPRWVFDTSLPALDQRAAATMERALSTDRPVQLGLREMASHRQREVRWLGVRGLACVQDYEPLLAALNDPDLRSEQWEEHVDLLRGEVLRGPQAAAQVRAAMEKVYGDDGTNLYAMLWKFRSEEIEPADARLLVKYLDHEALIFRRLSFWNLKTLTGMKYKYLPEDNAAKRQPAIQKWKERINANPTLRARPAEEEKPARKPAPSSP